MPRLYRTKKTSMPVNYPLIISSKKLTVNSTAIPVKLERRRPAGKTREANRHASMPSANRQSSQPKPWLATL